MIIKYGVTCECSQGKLGTGIFNLVWCDSASSLKVNMPTLKDNDLHYVLSRVVFPVNHEMRCLRSQAAARYLRMQEEINLLLDDPPYEEWRHRYRTWVLDGLIQFLKGKKGDAKDSEGENVEPVTKEDEKEMMPTKKDDPPVDQNLNDAGKQWCQSSVHIRY